MIPHDNKQPQYVVIMPPQENETVISVSDALLVLWKKKLFIVSLLFAGSIATGIYVMSLPNIYRASAVVTIRTEDASMGSSLMKGQLGGLANLVGINMGQAGDERSELLASLQSFEVAAPFVEANNLAPLLFAERWDSTKEAWKKNPPSRVEQTSQFLDNMLSVNEDKKTGLITVSIEMEDRKLAAELVNAYIESTNKIIREKKLAEAKEAIAYLQEEARKSTLDGVRSGLYQIIQGYYSRVALANIRDDFPYAFVDRAQQPELRDKIRPRRSLLTLLGGFFAAFLGSAFILGCNRKAFIYKGTYSQSISLPGAEPEQTV